MVSKLLPHVQCESRSQTRTQAHLPECLPMAVGDWGQRRLREESFR